MSKRPHFHNPDRVTPPPGRQSGWGEKLHWMCVSADLDDEDTAEEIFRLQDSILNAGGLSSQEKIRATDIFFGLFRRWYLYQLEGQERDNVFDIKTGKEVFL